MAAQVIDAGYRKRGVQTTVIFTVPELVATDANRFFNAAVPWVAGDVKISQDGGAVGNVTNLPTRIGATPLYTITLTAGEMLADTVDVYLVDVTVPPAWGDTLLQVKTKMAMSQLSLDANSSGQNIPGFDVVGGGTAVAASIAGDHGVLIQGLGGGVADYGLRIETQNGNAPTVSIANLGTGGPGVTVSGQLDSAAVLIAGGAGLYVEAQANGSHVVQLTSIAAAGGGNGIDITPGVTGNGGVVRGGATSGDGLQLTAPLAGDGLQVTATGAGAAAVRIGAAGVGDVIGMLIAGRGASAGLAVTGGGTGPGASITSGTGAAGLAISVGGGNGNAVTLGGGGTGTGLAIAGGLLGAGATIAAGAGGTGVGLSIAAPGSGDGLTISSTADQAVVISSANDAVTISSATGNGVMIAANAGGVTAVGLSASGAAGVGLTIDANLIGLDVNVANGTGRCVEMDSAGDGILVTAVNGTGFSFTGVVGGVFTGSAGDGLLCNSVGGSGATFNGSVSGLAVVSTGAAAALDILNTATGAGVAITASGASNGVAISAGQDGIDIAAGRSGVVVNTGGNGVGLDITGTGTGQAVLLQGGLNAEALKALAGGAGVAGFSVSASAAAASGILSSAPLGVGMQVSGAAGFDASGTSSTGISCTSGGAAAAFQAVAGGANGPGVKIQSGAGGDGVQVTSNGAGLGVSISAPGTGVGLRVAAAGADAAQFTSAGGNGDGIQATGAGNGFGFRAAGGSQDQGDIEGILDDSVLNTGLAQGGDATHIQLSAAASGLDDYYTGAGVLLVGGTGSGQVQAITGYVGATRQAAVSGWVTQPVAGTQYVVIPMGGGSGGGGLTAAQVWDHLEGAEPVTAIPLNASMREIMQHVKRFHFNKVAATNTRLTIYRDDSGTTLETSVRSFNKITAQRGQYA